MIHVMPARLFGLKRRDCAKVEMLMLTRIENNDWEVLLKPAKRIKVGNKLSFGEGKIIAECIEELDQVDVSCVCIMREFLRKIK